MSMAHIPFIRTDLRLLKVQGKDARTFLSGLITQRTDLPNWSSSYGAILTPQGKLLADFPIFFMEDDLVLLGLPATGFDSLFKKLSMFKLRSDVELAEETSIVVASDTSGAPLEFSDPRHPDLWHTLSNPKDDGVGAALFHILRGELGVPEGSYDLIFGKSTLIDEGLACAIDWDKGCYMGQEVTARMRYRALIKRVLVTVEGPIEMTDGEPILDGDKKIGEVRSWYLNRGFAYVLRQYAGTQLADMEFGQPIGLSDLGL